MLTIYGLQLTFEDSFKYFGHIIFYNLYNYKNIKKIHNFYIRTNIMLHCLSNCSMRLKVRLYCFIFFYDIFLSEHNSGFAPF